MRSLRRAIGRSDLPFISASSFPSLQAAINEQEAQDGKVALYIPAGEYVISTGIVLNPDKAHIIYGAGNYPSGQAASRIRNTGTGDALTINQTGAGTEIIQSIEDLSIVGAQTSGHGIYAFRVPGLILRRVWLANHGKCGGHFERCYGSRVDDVIATHNGEWGLRFHLESNAVRLNGVKVNNNGRKDGFGNIAFTGTAGAENLSPCIVGASDFTGAGLLPYSGVTIASATNLLLQHTWSIDVRGCYSEQVGGGANGRLILADSTVRGGSIASNYLQDGIVEIAAAEGLVFEGNTIRRYGATTKLIFSAPTETVGRLMVLGDNNYQGGAAEERTRTARRNPERYPATTLQAVGHKINAATRKVTAMQVINETTGLPMWAKGSLPTDPWVGLEGAVITPESANAAYLSAAGAVIAHRTGGDIIAPDNTLGAGRYAKSKGVSCIEFDVWLTDAGQLVCMHDTTLDRTTTGTGSVTAASPSDIAAAVADPSTYLGQGWPDEPIPLWIDVLREFGGRILLMAEAKNTAALVPMADAAEAYGVDPSTIVLESTSQAGLAAVAARGFKTMFLGNPTTADWASLAASGIQYFGGDHSLYTGPIITAAHAAGLKVAGYTVTRRFERDAFFALGGDMIFGSDPEYLLTSTPLRTTDNFSVGRWLPGMLSDRNVSRGTFSGSSWTPAINASYPGVLMGFLCPTADNVTIDFNVVFNSVTAADRWGGIAVACPDDRPYNDGAPWHFNCYHILFRQDGRLQIYPVTAGTGTGAATTQTGTALTLGASYHMRVTINATNVTMTNVTNSQTATLASTSARGGYFHFGNAGASVSISGVAVS